MGFLSDKFNDLAMKQAYNQIFSSFDRDNSGYLEPQEAANFLTTVLKHLGVNFNVSGGQASYAIKALDKDGDGKISKDEMYEIYKYFLQNFEHITGSKK